MQPASYPKRILIAVSGMTPQIVTETMYTLATNKVNPFIPTEIHLITTREGADNAELNLFKKNKVGWFNLLCQELNLENIDFSVKNIHIISNHQTGKFLDDIRTTDDNEVTANYITEFIREKCKDLNSALHVSIAGGRKTMGFYLAYALSLFGRKQDRLSHVLVDEKYESQPDFYFPMIQNQISDKKLGDDQNIISLAQIPFLRIKSHQAQYAIEGNTYTQTIREFQQQLTAATLIIDINQKLIQANHFWVKLPSSLFSFYIWVINRTLENNPVTSPLLEAFNKADAEEFLHYYKKTKGEMGDTDRTIVALKNGMTQDYIYSKVGDIKRKLKQLLGSIGAQQYLIQSKGTPRQYFIAIDKENINWIE